MKLIRIVGLCLAAVFALSAVAATSASAAAPEYKVCAKAAKSGKTYTGKYNNKTCSEVNAKGEGKYELESWEAAKKKEFKGKNGVSTLDSYIPASESEPWKGGTVVGDVTCKSGKSVGDITGPKTSTVTVEFKTCTSEGKKCTSPGAKTGSIVTKKLTSTLGYIDEGKAVGSLVEAGAGGGDPSAEFTCEGLGILTTGSVIGVNSVNVNTVSKAATQTFAVNKNGGQEVVFGEFPEGITGPAHFLLSYITPDEVTLPSGEDTTSTLTGEAMEIYAPGA